MSDSKRPRLVKFSTVSWDAWKAGRGSQADIRRRQRDRLQDLVEFARNRSAYLGGRYRDLPSTLSDVRQLPAVTKAEMMSHFDDWVTDPQVKRQDVEAFTADPGLIGHDFLNRYVVCTTSGATGTPAILLHDRDALTVYNALGYIRSLPAALSAGHIWALLRGRGRLAAVFVTGGHFLGNTMMARRYRALAWRARTQRLFSALSPVAELVDSLNAFQPVMLSGYPSALDVLAREQQAGRLHIHPVFVTAAGETLSDAARQRISTAFGCHVANYYGSSEAVGLTFECSAKRMHVNSDWYILEPVDEQGQPTPTGQLSSDVFVTNLANRIQPIIRYQLGDRVAIGAQPCPCGSPFPIIHVVGRTDDALVFPTAHNELVRILPLAIATVAEETPGVESCQLIQRGPKEITVRVAVSNSEQEHTVWPMLHKRITDYLSTQGIAGVMIDRAPEPPQLHPRSGKFRQVYSEAERQLSADDSPSAP